MKIDILRLIEDDLIGGRNGEMAYIENNPFIAQLYREWRGNNLHAGNTFKAFLTECLKEDKDDHKVETTITYKPITKRYNLSEYDEKHKEYKKVQNQIDDLKRNQSKILKELAESKNKELSDIGTYEIKDEGYGKYIEFKVLVEEIITKIDSGEEL